MQLNMHNIVNWGAQNKNICTERHLESGKQAEINKKRKNINDFFKIKQRIKF